MVSTRQLHALGLDKDAILARVRKGATWHDGKLASEDDAGRQAKLEANGERVLRVTWQQALTQPRQTVARLTAAGAPYTDRRS